MKLPLTLLSLIIAISCIGQVKPAGHTKAGKDKAPVLRTRISKTQGSGPYDNVHCAIRCKAGDLWFGTTGDGVYRFDGRYFINYTEKDGLSSNTVYSILEDKAGNIWVGTKAGLCRCEQPNVLAKIAGQRLAGKARFTAVPMSANNSGNMDFTASPTSAGAEPVVESMLQDSKGKIWFGTSDDGVYCYDGKSFTHFLHNDNVINKSGLHLNATNSIIEDQHGNIWFATWFEGVCRYDGTTITNFKPNGEVWYSRVLEDRAGDIWAGRRDKGVCRFDGNSFKNVLQNGIFDSCGIGAMIEDKAGNMWFGTEFGDMVRRETMGGVWRYDGKSFKNFTTKDGLTNNAVFCILEDKAGGIWVGTRNTGLCHYYGNTFTTFSE